MVDIVAEFVAAYELVWDNLTQEVGGVEGIRFVNTYAAYIASEIGLEELVDGELQHTSNGPNIFGQRHLDFSRVGSQLEDQMLRALSSLFNYRVNKPWANILYDFFEWVNARAKNEATRPELEPFVKRAYASQFVIEGRRIRTFSGFDYKREYKTKPQTSQYTWDDFGGADFIKEGLKRIIYFFNQSESFFNSHGPLTVFVPKGILFVGPPGTGKTLLAQIFAQESGLDFVKFDHTAFGSKYVNQTAVNLRHMIEDASVAVQKGYKRGVFIFIDEIEAATMARDERDPENLKTVTTLNNHMDGIYATDGVIFGGATNRPDLMDLALIRPGRFEFVVNLGVPDDETLAQIYKVHIRRLNRMRRDGVAFSPKLDMNAIVEVSSNMRYITEMPRDTRILIETAVLEGPQLDEFTEVARMVSRGELPPLRYNGLVTGAVVKRVVEGVYQAKVYELTSAGKPYEPIKTEELISAIKRFRRIGK